jgi:RecA/RadA recombinase
MSEIPEHWLGPLESGANRSGTVIVGVVDTPSRALAHASSFSLGFSRSEWISDRGQLVGLRTSARCVKNRVASPVGETVLEICYRLGAQSVKEASIQTAEMEACVSAAV